MSHVLSSDDLDRKYASNRLYGGCWPQDKVPPLDGHFVFVNLLLSTSPPDAVGHWLLCFDSKPDVCIYFDSMAERDAPVLLLRRMKETGKRILTNDQMVQSFSQSDCGVLDAFVADELLAGRSFYDIIHRMLRDKRFSENQRLALRETRF